MSRAILSYPFSGSIYSFFNQEASKKRFHYNDIKHPYYRHLYGKNFSQYTDISLAFLLIFDEVIMLPADEWIPERNRYTTNNIYNNKDLGLLLDDNYWRIDEEDEKIQQDLENPAILNILKNVRQFEQIKILKNIRYEMRLAEQYRCPIICGRGHKAIIAELTKYDTKIFNPSFAENYFKIVGFLFDVTTLDVLYKMKSMRSIRDYGRSFTKMMNCYSSKNISTEQMKKLIRESIDKKEVAQNVKGGFRATSTALAAGGLIPIIGSATSLGSLATAGGEKISERFVNKYSWFEMGTEINRAYSLATLLEELNLKP